MRSKKSKKAVKEGPGHFDKVGRPKKAPAATADSRDKRAGRVAKMEKRDGPV